MTEITENTYQPLGMAAIMRHAFSGESMLALSDKIIAHLNIWQEDANAMRDLSLLLQMTGHHDVGMAMLDQALALQQLYMPIPARPGQLHVLVFMAAGDLMANTPVELLVEGSDITLTLVYIGENIPVVKDLPYHDLMFAAVGHAPENTAVLSMLAQTLRHYPQASRIVNHPERITMLARDRASILLRDVPGLLMPPTVLVKRNDLAAMASGELDLDTVLPRVDFPVIVRPANSHAGRGLEKLGSATELAAYLASREGDDFYIAPFIDYSSGDGQFRKYRVILVDGKPFLAHMGISSNWMVHYLNAGMAENAGKRAEEARTMESFATGFAQRHGPALATIAERTQLAYVGIDCAEAQDGKLLIFEVDSNMVVHDLDSPDLYPYKRVQMQKLFAAFESLLKAQAR
jgi:glutathione synthase/RimK-type ligase-like ATP-grasp enzyme